MCLKSQKSDDQIIQIMSNHILLVGIWLFESFFSTELCNQMHTPFTLFFFGLLVFNKTYHGRYRGYRVHTRRVGLIKIHRQLPQHMIGSFLYT